LPVKSWKKYFANGKPVRVKQLGHGYVEILTSGHKRALQEDLCEAITDAKYTEDTKLAEGGNLICRLLSTSGMRFNELINKLVDLIVCRIEHYEKKSKKKLVSTRSSTTRHPTRQGKAIPNYRLPAGRVITT
jgi:hypothetical protein